MKPESLAILSHEMRASLSAIIGFSEALKDGLVGPMSEAQRTYICDIFASGKELLALVEGIAEGSNIEGDVAALPVAAGAAVMAVNEPTRIALVIDDDDRAADLLRLLLEAEGFSVLRAISAEDALLLVPQQTLALITLDLEMYGLNGWQFLQKVRESGASSGAPIVIVSGRSVANIARSRGAAAALQKPISRTGLKATLAELGLLKTSSTPTP
jgi:CheY-like chemotaxis protein